MKKIQLIFFVLITVTSYLCGQSFEGKIIYDGSYSGKNTDEMTLYVKNKKQRIELNLHEDGIEKAVIIVDSLPGSPLVLLLDLNTEKEKIKYAVKVTQEELDKDMNKYKNKYKLILSDETKEIAGYTCKKALLLNNQGELKRIIYYTPQIAGVALDLFEGPFHITKIEGFIMQNHKITSYSRNKIVAKELIKKNIADDMFEIPPDYKQIYWEEFIKVMEKK